MLEKKNVRVGCLFLIRELPVHAASCSLISCSLFFDAQDNYTNVQDTINKSAHLAKRFWNQFLVSEFGVCGLLGGNVEGTRICRRCLAGSFVVASRV